MGPLLLLVALSSAVPNYSLNLICRDAKNSELPEAKGGAAESCMHDEKMAHDQLVRWWTKIPAKSRQLCVEGQDASEPSYVELLTCLELDTGKNFDSGTDDRQ